MKDFIGTDEILICGVKVHRLHGTLAKSKTQAQTNASHKEVYRSKSSINT